MKRLSHLTWLIAVGVLAAGAAVTVLEACGGTADETPAGDGDAGDAGSSSGSSGDGQASADGASSSGGGDGGGGSDGSTPGKIGCGAATCDVANALCCVQGDGGQACEPNRNQCSGLVVRLECDDSADCTGGKSCCLSAGAGSFVAAATCETRCGLAEPKLCKTNAECGDAGACNLKTCFRRPMQVCGDPQVCN